VALLAARNAVAGADGKPMPEEVAL
jgi:hypothetical protein